jgi:hypothetical protein
MLLLKESAHTGNLFFLLFPADSGFYVWAAHYFAVLALYTHNLQRSTRFCRIKKRMELIKKLRVRISSAPFLQRAKSERHTSSIIKPTHFFSFSLSDQFSGDALFSHKDNRELARDIVLSWGRQLFSLSHRNVTISANVYEKTFL